LLIPAFSAKLNPSMTERKEAQPLPLVRSGVEGYVKAMQVFPRLKEWENQIALSALREGKSVEDLRWITPFRQYLRADQRATTNGEVSHSVHLPRSLTQALALICWSHLAIFKVSKG
jgi:hypothetical protein